MKAWQRYSVGLVGLLVLTQAGCAGMSGASGGGASSAASAAGVDPSADPATQATQAMGAAGQAQGLLGQIQAMCCAAKQCFCECPLGQLVNQATMPLSLMSGGLIPPCCPTTPNLAQQANAKAQGGAVGAAAAIAADEADAPKRRAAVRYLGTVDCHWWPEAEAGLITALRTDRNECVRWEAAKALGNGCCCTKRVIEALTITAESSEKDGNPAENSERVKDSAMAALQHCLCCYSEKVPVKKEEGPIKERPRVEGESTGSLDPRLSPTAGIHESPEGPASMKLTAFYQEAKGRSLEEIVKHGREVVLASKFNAVKPDAPGNLPAGHQSIYEIFVAANGPHADRSISDENTTKEPSLAEGGAKPILQPNVAQIIQRADNIAKGKPEDGEEVADGEPTTVIQAGGGNLTTTTVAPGKVVWSSETATPDDDDDDEDNPKLKPTAPAEAMAHFTSGQLVEVLRGSDDAAQRQAAASLLPRSPWQANPDVIPSLMAAMTHERLATVRVECIRSLARMKANYPQVKAALQSLRSDSDPRVRYEAVHALMALGK
jgi:hypothetical protein